MNKITLSTIAALSLLSAMTYAGGNLMIIGDESSLYQPSNEDFNRISKAIEYYDAKKRLIRSQVEVRDLTLDANVGGAARQSPPATGSSVPRHMRGRADGDVLVDDRGNTIGVQKRPVAFISSVSGMSGSLSAELVWGDMKRIVRRGDALVGNWKVDSVNNDDIIISNAGRRLRIGAMPVDIDDIMAAM